MSHKSIAVCFVIILSMSLIPITFLVNPVAGSTGLYTVAYNPYAGIDWNTVLKLKTELHAHSNLGGGGSEPYQVINSYAALGFDALGISDYNRLTWPWSQWEEYLSEAAQNMVAIPNDQVSPTTAHILAPFLTAAVNGTNYGSDVQAAINAILAVGGVPILSSPKDMGFSLVTADSWTGFQGVEIFNPMDGGLAPFDFQLWDHLLTDPARAQKHIWGFASDDSHDGDLNHGWVVVFASAKTAASMKSSIVAGSFVSVVNYTNPIANITQSGNTFTVGTSLSVVWKADGLQTVGTGNTLNLDTLGPGYTYVRAEVNGTAFTQPIFITQNSPTTIFSNGFEDGFASWTNTVKTAAPAFIGQSLDTSHSGSYSEKIAGIRYSGDKAFANKSLGASYKRVDVRAYVNFTNTYASGAIEGPLSLSSSTSYLSVVARNFTTNKWGIRAYSPINGESFYWESGTSSITTNTWHYIELEGVMSVHGFTTLWVDGVMKLNVTNFNFYTSMINSVQAGVYQTLSPMPGYLKFYVDDVMVSDSYIGSIQHSLTVGVSGHGVTNATGSFTYPAFSIVTVSATPDSGWTLDHWTLNGTTYGPTSMFTINMTANYELIAFFNPPSTYLVVRGETNMIYYRGYNPATLSWDTWNVFPEGTTADTPAAALVGNLLYVVVRGVNYNQIWFSYVNIIDNSFSGWTLLEGSTPSVPILTANSTTLCLVVRGETNLIWYRFYDIASKVWGDWTSIPNGATNDTPAATLLGGTLQIVVRGVNEDQIWHCYINLADNSFGGWTLLEGSTPSVPTLTSNSTTLSLVVRGETNVIWYRFYDVASKVWGDWSDVPNGTTPDTPAASLHGGTLQIVVRGVNEDQIWHGYVNLADNTFSGWTLLDGATPSRPTLAD